MSTAFEIRAPKTHITTDRLWKWLKDGDITLGYKPKSAKDDEAVVPVTKKSQIKDSVVMSLPDNGGFIWFYRSGKRVWHSFERYGCNDPDPIIDFVEAATGGHVLCEHDEEFWT